MRFAYILKLLLLLCFTQLMISSCISSRKEWGSGNTSEYNVKYYQTGKASYYGSNWTGHKTANGEHYDSALLTAASKTIPFNSKVFVKDKATGRFVVVRINDRGPYIKDRIIDLSEAAAFKLGIHKRGVATVELYIVKN